MVQKLTISNCKIWAKNKKVNALIITQKPTKVTTVNYCLLSIYIYSIIFLIRLMYKNLIVF